MKIVFYSTNSNHYSEESFKYINMPPYNRELTLLKENHPEHEFLCIVQKPGMFLYDSSVKDAVCLPQNLSADEVAEKIIEQKPDIAVACTYWTQPFDWLTMNDSVIAEKLRNAGIKTYCHTPQTAELCFNKKFTHDFLVSNRFKCARAVYVHHEMFYAERSKPVVQKNVYKDYVLYEISKLNFPVVIKDTGGLSSYGMDVARTYNEAVHIFNSKKFNGDRLVEEFIEGDSFGVEIYGKPGNYYISEVLINSVNQFGLTSPKQNVKLGPVQKEEFKVPQLKEEMRRLGEALKLNGIAQVDLIFSNGEWYIVEINSRISGMTQTVLSGMNLTVFDLLYKVSQSDSEKLEFPESDFVMNMKFPLLNEDERKALFDLPFVKYVNQIENNEAKQLREVGYAEVVFCGKTLDELMKNLETIKNTLPSQMESVFYENAKKLKNIICA